MQVIRVKNGSKTVIAENAVLIKEVGTDEIEIVSEHGIETVKLDGYTELIVR